MGACSFKAVINKENRKNKSGLHSLYIRVTLNRKSIYLKLDQKIDETTWLGKDGKWVKDSCHFAFEINSIIRAKIITLQEFEIKQRLANNVVTLEKLQKAFSSKGNMACVNDYYQNWIDNVKGKAEGTIKQYKTSLMNFNLFNQKILFNQLDNGFLQKYADWLRHEKKFKKPTTSKIIMTFKRVCKDAVEDLARAGVCLQR